jgi:DNA-binding GntR family transcriptional regulator
MTRTHAGSVPAYKKIQVSIMNRIKAGELKPHQAVESERVLAGLHSVSPMTARHALVELEREGVVERRTGAGTFVALPKIHFNKLTSFTEEMAARNLSVCSKVLSLKIVDKEPEVAERLCLPSTSRLIKLERLRKGGDEPFAIETCYLSGTQFGELTRANLERGSLYSILEHEYGVELAYADEDVDAVVADPRTASLLTIHPGQPLLRIRQVIYSTKGKATIYGVCLNRAERHILRIRRVR